MKPIYFSSHLDALSKIITVGCLLLTAGIGLSMVLEGGVFRTSFPLAILGIFPLIFGVYFFSMLWAPRGFFIHGHTIIIRRMIGNKLIRVKGGLDYLGPLPKGIRLFGSGGFFGYFGLFKLKGLGRVWVYATRRVHLILVNDVSGKKFIISPDDVGKFMQVFKEET